MTVTHKHHIIPKHMGGSDDPSNIIELTVEEHAEAHKILWEKYGRWQDEIAWKGLSGIIGHEEVVREILSRSASNTHKRRLSDGSHNFLNSEKQSDLGKRSAKKMLELGTHPFFDSEKQKETVKKRKASGKDNFTNSVFQKKMNEKAIAKQKNSGKHPFHVMCSCKFCGKVTNLANIKRHENKCAENFNGSTTKL
jgi:hypothetical protein